MRKATTEVASYFEGCTAAKKATTEASGYYKGYREGCHIVGRLLQRLHAIVKVATEVDGCYGGCHIGFCEGCNEALWLMRRLPHRLKADAKAAIKVVGFYKGCHIAEKEGLSTGALDRALQRGFTGPSGALRVKSLRGFEEEVGGFDRAYTEIGQGVFEEEGRGLSGVRFGGLHMKLNEV
ncbi:hypothetical protein Tco_1076883 [Tanacetum coccineum]